MDLDLEELKRRILQIDSQGYSEKDQDGELIYSSSTGILPSHLLSERYYYSKLYIINSDIIFLSYVVDNVPSD